jgi:hypothetical protein
MLIPFHNDWPTIDEDPYFDALVEAFLKVERPVLLEMDEQTRPEKPAQRSTEV